MARAEWNGETLATSRETKVVEGNHYFPPESVVWSHLRPSAHRSQCSWKGTAHYYDVIAGGEINREAAWVYPDPLPAAGEIRGCLAFWKGVSVHAD